MLGKVSILAFLTGIITFLTGSCLGASTCVVTRDNLSAEFEGSKFTNGNTNYKISINATTTPDTFFDISIDQTSTGVNTQIVDVIIEPIEVSSSQRMGIWEFIPSSLAFNPSCTHVLTSSAAIARGFTSIIPTPMNARWTRDPTNGKGPLTILVRVAIIFNDGSWTVLPDQQVFIADQRIAGSTSALVAFPSPTPQVTETTDPATTVTTAATTDTGDTGDSEGDDSDDSDDSEPTGTGVTITSTVTIGSASRPESSIITKSLTNIVLLVVVIIIA